MKFVDAIVLHPKNESLIVNTVDFHSSIFEKNFQTISYIYLFLASCVFKSLKPRNRGTLSIPSIGGSQSSIAVKLQKSHIFVRSFLCSNSIGPPGSFSLTISLDTL